MKAQLVTRVLLILVSLFPMVAIPGALSAIENQSTVELNCDNHYALLLDKVRLISKNQIGFYYSLFDRCGVSRKLPPHSVDKVMLMDQPIPVWRLDWIAETQPRQGIQALSGFNQIMLDESSAAFHTLSQALKDNRGVNRIEIKHIKGEIRTDSPVDLGVNPELIQLARDILLSQETAGINGDIQIVVSGDPAAELTELPEGRGRVPALLNEYAGKTRFIYTDSPNNTESRYFLKFVESSLARPENSVDDQNQPEPPIAFSEIEKTVFVNAEIINKSQEEKQTWYYRPDAVTVSDDGHFNPVGTVKNPAEIKGYFSTFDSEVGHNVLILDFQKHLDESVLRLDTSFMITDDIRYSFQVTVHTEEDTLERQSCDNLDNEALCSIDISLEKYDRDMIAFWNGDKVESRWLRRSTTIRELFESGDYEGCVNSINRYVDVDMVPDNMPIPLAGEWLYMAAESFRKVNEPDRAAKLYRTIIQQYPYSGYYTTAWYRLAEINSGQSF